MDKASPITSKLTRIQTELISLQGKQSSSIFKKGYRPQFWIDHRLRSLNHEATALSQMTGLTKQEQTDISSISTTIEQINPNLLSSSDTTTKKAHGIFGKFFHDKENALTAAAQAFKEKAGHLELATNKKVDSDPEYNLPSNSLVLKLLKSDQDNPVKGFLKDLQQLHPNDTEKVAKALNILELRLRNSLSKAEGNKVKLSSHSIEIAISHTLSMVLREEYKETVAPLYRTSISGRTINYDSAYQADIPLQALLDPGKSFQDKAEILNLTKGFFNGNKDLEKKQLKSKWQEVNKFAAKLQKARDDLAGNSLPIIHPHASYNDIKAALALEEKHKHTMLADETVFTRYASNPSEFTP